MVFFGHFDQKTGVNENESVFFHENRERALSRCINTTFSPLDETHLDAMRGLILPRGFHPAHQQVELVRAMRLCLTRTNRSAYAYAKELI